MNAVSCQEERKEEELQSSEGDVGCDEQGRSGTGGENTGPKVFNEETHDGLLFSASYGISPENNRIAIGPPGVRQGGNDVWWAHGNQYPQRTATDKVRSQFR